MGDLKTVLDRLKFSDDAKVQSQLVDQILRVKIRLAPVRRKLLVLSGKGGVGKSAVTSQLALALARGGGAFDRAIWRGNVTEPYGEEMPLPNPLESGPLPKSVGKAASPYGSVGILDADLNGPSIPRMLGMADKRFLYEEGGVRPPEGPYGIKVAAMSFVTDPTGPLRWKGPMDLTPVWLGMMESAVIREFLSDTVWGELDALLFDLPPGAAADKPPAIANLIPDIHGALVVTTGSAVALEVVRRSMLYARDLGIPILGIVENMSGLFAGSADALAQEMKTPILARVPMDKDLASSLDTGVPLDESHPVSRIFRDLARKLQ